MDETTREVFKFFNEVGIIHQLSATAFSRRLPEGLHLSHFSALNHLIRLGDGRTPRQMADSFQVPKGTMTHTLKVLTDRGFIRQEPNPKDKRSKIVFLTREGRSYHARALESAASSVEKMAELLGLDTISELLPHLIRIREILDANRDI